MEESYCRRIDWFFHAETCKKLWCQSHHTPEILREKLLKGCFSQRQSSKTAWGLPTVIAWKPATRPC